MSKQIVMDLLPVMFVNDEWQNGKFWSLLYKSDTVFCLFSYCTDILLEMFTKKDR